MFRHLIGLGFRDLRVLGLGLRVWAVFRLRVWWGSSYLKIGAIGFCGASSFQYSSVEC